MTQPGRVPPERDRRALQPYLRVQRISDAQVLKELANALKDAEKHLKRLDGTGIGQAVRRDQIRAVIAAIKEEIRVMWQRILVVTFDNRRLAAEAAVKADAVYETQFFRRAGYGAEYATYKAGLAAEAGQGIDTLRHRLSTSKMKLAESVYYQEALANDRIDRIINSALARGLSARELAFEVRRYIRPDVRGGVSYAAMRLSRTELNNAFHARTVAFHEEKPWVEATKWCLSGSHPRPDACDDYAGRSHFPGGGPGEYRPGDVPPKPHPHCLCFMIPILVPETEFQARLLGGDYDNYLRPYVS